MIATSLGIEAHYPCRYRSLISRRVRVDAKYWFDERLVEAQKAGKLDVYASVDGRGDRSQKVGRVAHLWMEREDGHTYVYYGDYIAEPGFEGLCLTPMYSKVGPIDHWFLRATPIHELQSVRVG